MANILKPIRENYIIILILFLGCVLRFVNLEGRCFWCDELESYNRVVQPVGEMLSELIRNTPRVPLYYTFLHFWLMFIGTSDAFARTLSSLFGVMTILVSYHFFRKLFDRKVALLSAFLLAISPFHIMLSRIVREYALVGLLSVCSMFCFWLVISAKSNRFYKWLIYGIVSFLLVSTHYYCWFIIIAQGVFLLICRREKLKLWIVTNGIMFTIFLPWIVLNFLFRLRGEWDGALTTYTSATFGYFIKAAYFFYSFTLGQTIYPFNLYIVVPLLATFIVFIYGMIYLLREHDQYKKIILFWLFVPFIIGMFLPLYAPRQLLVSLPAFCLILATGIVKMRYAWLKWIIGAVIILTCAYSNYNYFTNRQYFDVDMVTPWREIAKDVSKKEETSDAVILGRLMEGFPHYYRGALPIYRIDPFGSPEQIKQYREKHKRLWILLHSERPRENFEQWMTENGEIILTKKYLYEENTLKGLRESFKNIHKYHEYKYKLYLFKLE